MAGKNIAAAWHRRAGKDSCLLNAMAVKAMQRPASYAYGFPEIAHARRAMWNSVDSHTGRRRIYEAFPREILASDPNETEMRLKFINGSELTFFGLDNYDRLVGAGLAGIVSSEHALGHPSAYAFFSPMLRENNGFFWAISTPRGSNHFKTLMDHAGKSNDWFAETLPVTQTGALTDVQIEEARAEYISLYGEDAGDSYFRQEYLCDWSAALLGAFFAREMAAVRSEDRIDPNLEAIPGVPVHRSFDIGVRDDTVIFWFQIVGGQIFILDVYAASGAGVDHFADVIKQRREEYGWDDGIDFVPHDAKVREWGTGRTRVETMQNLGLNPQVVPMASKMDQINAARQTLPRCVFHSRTETIGVVGLEQYRREYDSEKKVFRANPLHDYNSHVADSFLYLSMAWRTAHTTPKRPAIQRIGMHEMVDDGVIARPLV